jgi:hypothetical protein
MIGEDAAIVDAKNRLMFSIARWTGIGSGRDRVFAHNLSMDTHHG